MKLYLDTSSPKTIIKLDQREYEWDSGRSLARDIFKKLHELLSENNQEWQDISEIHFMSGPGSFTGLRIGAVVVNTLANELKVPLYNHRGEKMAIIIPEYGRPANITPPKK